MIILVHHTRTKTPYRDSNELIYINIDSIDRDHYMSMIDRDRGPWLQRVYYICIKL